MMTLAFFNPSVTSEMEAMVRGDIAEAPVTPYGLYRCEFHPIPQRTMGSQ